MVNAVLSTSLGVKILWEICVEKTLRLKRFVEAYSQLIITTSKITILKFVWQWSVSKQLFFWLSTEVILENAPRTQECSFKHWELGGIARQSSLPSFRVFQTLKGGIASQPLCHPLGMVFEHTLASLHFPSENWTFDLLRFNQNGLICFCIGNHCISFQSNLYVLLPNALAVTAPNIANLFFWKSG